MRGGERGLVLGRHLVGPAVWSGLGKATISRKSAAKPPCSNDCDRLANSLDSRDCLVDYSLVILAPQRCRCFIAQAAGLLFKPSTASELGGRRWVRGFRKTIQGKLAHLGMLVRESCAFPSLLASLSLETQAGCQEGAYTSSLRL